MISKKVSAALALSATLLASPALADGFAVYEWSARAFGMGGAGMFSGEVSAIAANPAAITSLDEKGQFSASISHIDPRGYGSFWKGDSYMGTEHNRDNPGIVPTMFYARKVQPNAWFGVGVFPRFGLKASYEPGWMGSYNSHSAEFTTFSIVPTIAWKLGPTLSMSFNGELMYTNLIIDKYAGVYGSPAHTWNMNLDGTSWGVGWGAGLNWEITPKWTFAFLYRSQVTQEMNSADVKFRGLSSNGNMDTTASGTVVLPESFTFGLGYKFNDRTRVEFNAIRTNWSSYDTLSILFRSFPLTGGDPHRNDEPKKWQDGWRYQFGIEHQLNKRWTVRAGYTYDSLLACDEENKYTDFMVPTGKRQTFTVGCSYRNKNIEYSLGYGYMIIDDKVIRHPAGTEDPYNAGPTYATSNNNDAHIVALGIRVDM